MISVMNYVVCVFVIIAVCCVAVVVPFVVIMYTFLLLHCSS